MSNQFTKSIKILEEMRKNYRRIYFICGVFTFYFVGWSAINWIFIWANDGKDKLDWAGAIVGIAFDVFEVWLICRVRRKRRSIEKAISIFKAANITFNYTAKDHHADQALAAINAAYPGVTAHIVNQTLVNND